MIPITKPFLPPPEEYNDLLQGIWEREYLTNNGPLVQELESKLIEYLDVKNLVYVANGTIALQIAIQALGLDSEIITTPFSYVATTSSIVWEKSLPVYVDIDPYTFNIDHTKIEEAITSKTTAIIATHVFGNPCEIDEIQNIANKYNLKIIFDASHCFGTNYKGKSVFQFGDVSTASFHATKVFHTVEGGALFSNDDKIVEKFNFMRNFGHNGPSKFNGVGINGKNSEFHAAMGLCNLNYIDEILSTRKSQSQYYEEELKKLRLLQFQKINSDSDFFNFAYYPILFDTEQRLLSTVSVLEENDIYTRRYFYPSLTDLDYVQGVCPISDSVSKRILCLPLYHDLRQKDQDHIISIIRGQFE